MEQQALTAAASLTERYMERLGGDWIDGQMLAKAALAGYLTGSGVPTDEAVQMAERMAAPQMVGRAPRHPFYYGLPWMVPGPVSGAPYYAD